MREAINYIIEANLGLLLFLVAYKVLLRHETNFRAMRFFMLAAISIAVTFPLLHLNNASNNPLPTFNNVVPAHWLPEIVVTTGDENVITQSNVAYDFWRIAAWIYGAGVSVFLMWLASQLINVFKTISHGSAYRLTKFKIIESSADKPTFSFFYMIYIGNADQLSNSEKEQIITHEAVHAEQLHSLDILLVTLLNVVFWFNPFINIYKKIFVQLHEFEADARAVENSDVNKYCSLLARVALQSAHFPIASHFNQSLTLKRIHMMRTIKKKIRPWKIAALAAIIFVSFYFVACQDQVSELSQSTISQTGDYPPEVKAQMEEYKKKFPDAELTYIDGIPEEIDKLISSPLIQEKIIYTFDLSKEGIVKKGVLFNNVSKYAETPKTENDVFVVVENQPEYPGGIDALTKFLRLNIKYPKASAEAGTNGTVFISFIINTDGTVSDASVVKGVDSAMDAEALRVVNLLPPWTPGKQNGKLVRVKFTIPIRFNVNEAKPDVILSNNFQMKASFIKTASNGKTFVKGHVSNEDKKPLIGANILLKGHTIGTTTDAQGNFKIDVPVNSGQLVISHVGYEFETIDF